jgi:hypothetical protein
VSVKLAPIIIIYKMWYDNKWIIRSLSKSYIWGKNNDIDTKGILNDIWHKTYRAVVFVVVWHWYHFDFYFLDIHFFCFTTCSLNTPTTDNHIMSVKWMMLQYQHKRRIFLLFSSTFDFLTGIVLHLDKNL